MSNPYYTPTGNPLSLARGVSAQMRNEFSLIGLGFDALSAGAVLIPIVTRTANVQITSSNIGNMIEYTAGNFSQTFSDASTLGAGWFVYVKNASLTDIVTLAPSQTVDGMSSIVMYPGESFAIISNGTVFKTYGREKQVYINETAFSSVASVSITTPFSDPEITMLDYSTTLFGSTSSELRVSVGNWSAVSCQRIVSGSTTVSATNASTTYGAIGSTLSSISASINLRFDRLKSVAACGSKITGDFYLSNSVNGLVSMLSSVQSAAPNSMTLSCASGTITGNYSLVLYRGRNV